MQNDDALVERIKRIFDDAGGSDALVDLLTEFGFEDSRELAEHLAILPQVTGTPEVTDADRVAAASVAVLTEMRELILAGRADYHAEPFARHRAAGYAAGAVEGAKAMQTKAVEVAAWSHMVPPDGGSPSEDECAVARAAADAIAALDPAQITGANHDR